MISELITKTPQPPTQWAMLPPEDKVSCQPCAWHRTLEMVGKPLSLHGPNPPILQLTSLFCVVLGPPAAKWGVWTPNPPFCTNPVLCGGFGGSWYGVTDTDLGLWVPQLIIGYKHVIHNYLGRPPESQKFRGGPGRLFSAQNPQTRACL